MLQKTNTNQSAGSYDRNAYYLFVMREAAAGSEPVMAAAGDMPRGKQFGYLFGGGDARPDARLAAHELGHGIFTLTHTFDSNYGGGASQGQTANLMDYTGGTELGAFQWSVTSNPAPLTWFDTDEDAMAIVYESTMHKVFRENFIKTLNLLLNNNTGGIFNYVHKSVSESPEIFQVNTYQLKDIQYIDPLTRGYFRAAEDITAEISWLDKIIAKVLGVEAVPEIIKAGSELAPHYIRFTPPDKSQGKNIETTTKSPTTVFEELFHAAQYLHYKEGRTRILTETEVKVARAYVTYINGGASGKDFSDWTSTDNWGRTVLATNAGKYKYQGIIDYFEAIKSKKKITNQLHENYKKAVTTYVQEVLLPVYKDSIKEDINMFSGETPFLKLIIEK